MGGGRIFPKNLCPSLFNDDLSNEPNFSLIHPSRWTVPLKINLKKFILFYRACMESSALDFFRQFSICKKASSDINQLIGTFLVQKPDGYQMFCSLRGCFENREHGFCLYNCLIDEECTA